MRKPLRFSISALAITLLALMPSVTPFGIFSAPASAVSTSSGTTDCEQTYTVNSGSPAVAAYQSGTLCYVSFKNDGTTATLSWDRPSNVYVVDALVVGGGGGGGAHVGAGGGAGGLLNLQAESVSGSTVDITVGSGGAGAFTQSGDDISRASGTAGISYPGAASVFGSNTAAGGGRGAFWWNDNGSGVSNGAAGSGGSGGGAVARVDNSVTSGGSASPAEQGFAGGSAGNAAYLANDNGYLTGGGGGAGAPGGSADHVNMNSGDGGAGLPISWVTTTAASALGVGHTISSSVYFAGGGGGGFHDILATGGAGSGGDGGGGDGAGPPTASDDHNDLGATDGTAATGGGGGGAGASSSGTNLSTGGSGGSGVVIVRYSLLPSAPTGLFVRSDSTTQVSLSWNAPTHTPGSSISSYVIEYQASGGSWTAFTDPGRSATQTSATITGLTPGTAYLFRVSAVNSSGQGSYSGSLPALDISSSGSKVIVPSSGFSSVCSGSCDVTGFQAEDPILVVVSKSDGSALSGRLRLDSASFTGGLTLGDLDGVTGYNGGSSANLNSDSGYPDIAFVGTQVEVNIALETLAYEAPVGGGSELIGISASLNLSGAAYNSGNGHYYKFVNTSLPWTDAKAAAAASTFNGLTGYLATITSAEENAFIVGKTGGTSSWIGASDEYSQINAATGAATFANQTAAEGHWYWVTGPEAGTEFWDEAGNTSSSADGRISGKFQYWNNAINQSGWGSEPNDSGGEHYVQLLVGGTGNWNDLPSSSSLPYVVEYGDSGSDALKEVSTTIEVGPITAPLQVTALSAASGDGRVALSWSAPGTGGSTITDYVVEQSADGGSSWTTVSDGTSTATSYTVTGLTNGTAYSFRIAATNAIGTGTASSTATATPAAAASSSGGSSDGGTGSTPVVTPATNPPVVAPARVIVPPQPTPQPRILSGPVRAPGRNFDPSVGTRATVGGAPATVTSTPLTNRGVLVRTGTVVLGFNPDNGAGGGGSQNPSANSSDLTVASGKSTTVSGGGLLPGSQMQVWLPGTNGLVPKELARIPVKSDGTFDSQVSFTSRQSETPIPIGPQVMQVTGYDAQGNQTVVDMTINIAQGSPEPEPNRLVDALPELGPGQSLATSAGVPEIVTIEARPEAREVAVTSGEWAFNVSLPEDAGRVEQVAAGANITLTQSRSAAVSGEGFQPDTRVDVWLFSTPTLLGSMTVSADGSFSGEVYLDSRFAILGEHTLQLQGVAEDGFVKAANLGVVVQESVVLASDGARTLMIWGAVSLVAVAVAFAVALWMVRRRRRDTQFGYTGPLPVVR